MNQRPINLRRERDFGQKLNATFVFIGQNFKPLFKTLLLYASPFALLAGVFNGIFQSRMFSVMGKSILGTSTTLPLKYLSEMFSVYYLFALLFMAAGYIVVSATVYGYMIEYMDTEENPIQPARVWEHIKRNFFPLLGSAIANVFICIIGMVFLIIPGIYLMIVLSLFFVVRMRENKNFGDAFSRCFYLIRNKWWSTFGLIIVAAMIQAIIGIVFQIPLYIYTFTVTLHLNSGNTHPTFQIISVIISTVGAMMLYAISNIAIAFQYFNLVEKKDGTGLKEELDSIGQSQQQTGNNEGEF